jgi:hypothetical protein
VAVAPEARGEAALRREGARCLGEGAERAEEGEGETEGSEPAGEGEETPSVPRLPLLLLMRPRVAAAPLLVTTISSLPSPGL